MYSISSFAIELDRPNGVYFSGETVTGRVKLVTSNNIDARGVHIALKCIGHMQHTITRVDTNGGVSTSICDGKKTYEEIRSTLMGEYFTGVGPVIQRTTLPAGTFERGFSFPVRVGAIGSADVSSWDTQIATIRYSLVAYVDLGKLKEPCERPSNPSTSLFITVLPSRPLPSPDMLRAIEYMHSQPKRIPYRSWLPCCSKGTFTIEAKLGRQAFASGETLDFHFRVQNNSSVALEIEIQLVCTLSRATTPTILSACRKVTLQTRSGHPFHQCMLEPYKVYEVGHNATGDNSNANREVSAVHANLNYDLNLTLPTVPPSFNGAPNLASSDKVDPVILEYRIEFMARTPGTPITNSYLPGIELGRRGSIRSSVFFPVVICAAPPSASALQAARGINSTQPAIQLPSPAGGHPLQYNMDYVPEENKTDVAPVPTVVPLKPISTKILEKRSFFAPRIAVATDYQPYALSYAADAADATAPTPVGVMVQT